MSVLRVARASLKADALLVFSWVGEDTAVVRDASSPEWQRVALTLPFEAITAAGGTLLERATPRDLVSTALASTLSFAPAAVLALHSVGQGPAPLGGLLALWESVEHVPARIAAEPRRSCSELARMTDEWLRQGHASDRADLFDQVMQCIPDAIIYLPEDGHHAEVNAAAAQLLDLPAGHVSSPDVAMRLRTFGSRVVNTAERDAMAATVFGRGADVVDSLWELRGDEPQFFRVSCFNVSSGALRGRIWTMRDVTAAERTLRVLSQRKALYRSQHQFLQGVLEAMDDAVVASDANGTVTLLNSSARQRLGLDDAVGAGSVLERIFGDDDAATAEMPSALTAHPLRRAMAGDDVTNLPLSAQRTGGRRDLLVSARALRDADGKITGAVSVERDVTERNVLEAQIRQNEKLQALGRMAAAITHDVNNLLTVMHGSIATLAAGGRQSPTFDDEVTTLAAAVEESRAMTRNLLDFCRGRVRVPEVVSLGTIVRRLQGLLRRMAAVDVVIDWDIDADEPLTVLGNGAELEQVVLNLCANANDAMPGGGHMRVLLQQETVTTTRTHHHGVVPPGTYVAFQVSDTGTGMEPDVLARIFEPFYTTRGDSGGTGLGLSTVYGIVDRYGGHLAVDSIPGQGTTFTAYLPGVSPTPPVRTPLATPAQPMRSVQPPVAAEESADPRPRAVLVVDDDALVRRAVSRLVSLAGFTVHEAGSGADALSVLAARSVDLVLSDVQMPEMDGSALVHALRARRIATPVVLMSGYSDLEDSDLLMLSGVRAFLTKPFSSEELARALAVGMAPPAGRVDRVVAAV